MSSSNKMPPSFFSVHRVHDPVFHTLIAKVSVGVRNFSSRDPSYYPTDPLEDVFKARKYNLQLLLHLPPGTSSTASSSLCESLSAELVNTDEQFSVKEHGFRTFIKNKTVDSFTSIPLRTFSPISSSALSNAAGADDEHVPASEDDTQQLLLRGEFAKVNINYVSEGQRERKMYRWMLTLRYHDQPLVDLISTPFKAVGRATSLVRESPGHHHARQMSASSATSASQQSSKKRSRRSLSMDDADDDGEDDMSMMMMDEDEEEDEHSNASASSSERGGPVSSDRSPASERLPPRPSPIPKQPGMQQFNRFGRSNSDPLNPHPNQNHPPSSGASASSSNVTALKLTPPMTVHEPLHPTGKAPRMTPLIIPPAITSQGISTHSAGSAGSAALTLTEDDDRTPMAVLHSCIQLINSLRNPLERSLVSKMVHERFVCPASIGTSALTPRVVHSGPMSRFMQPGSAQSLPSPSMSHPPVSLIQSPSPRVLTVPPQYPM